MSVAQCRGVELLQARVCVSPIDHQPLSALLRRVEHHVGEQLLHDAAQGARPSFFSTEYSTIALSALS